MTKQGTLALDEAEEHSSPFAGDDDDPADDDDRDSAERTGTTLADWGSAGQSTIEGFGGDH